VNVDYGYLNALHDYANVQHNTLKAAHARAACFTFA
jgi:hypothetical protein